MGPSRELLVRGDGKKKNEWRRLYVERSDVVSLGGLQGRDGGG